MFLIDYATFLSSIKGCAVTRPNAASRGTLSGHAAGEPFEKLVYARLKALYPAMVYKQYEYLNDLYRTNPTVISIDDRKALFDSPVALFLLSRGDKATANWSPTNLFEEKQDDTADILAHQGERFELIDVKTHNCCKKSRPPNIISAYKLAQMCACMFDNARFEDISLNYLEIEWKERADSQLVCTDTAYATLFRIPPEQLYINWAAAMQIQFYVHDVEQTFPDDPQAWAKAYLSHFVRSAQERCDVMRRKYIEPFTKYIA